MPTNTNVSSTAAGIVNHAVGTIVTTSAAAAALIVTVGFVPRAIRVHNITDRISDEWFEGMDELALYGAIIATTAKLDADAGITATDFGATTNPASASLAGLKASLVALGTALDADTDVVTVTYSASAPSAASVAAIRTSLAAITTKLDADTGVTDTTYGSLWAVTAPALHTVANGTRTHDLDVGILNNYDGTFTLSATTMVASKVFAWEAIG